MHNSDDKHPTRPGLEPNTSVLQATTGPNEPSGPACIYIYESINFILFYIKR